MGDVSGKRWPGDVQLGSFERPPWFVRTPADRVKLASAGNRRRPARIPWGESAPGIWEAPRYTDPWGDREAGRFLLRSGVTARSVAVGRVPRIQRLSTGTKSRRTSPV
ncbi:hypothetical protein GCM10011583_20510 [Streptomyces camponoticapitis]|uniref:Uncharacterized protein n=1 Tax=Streptomyces camponoticapitis TaxID=1616125 RepID=A0ABQ2E214_9ACTN|nr:hypothetical protein GCM10011583_20510 [Streptomyces camponoticapitis]